MSLIDRIMTFIFGASWRSTTSAYATALAMYFYTNPKALHGIPEPYQGYIWNALEYAVYAGLLTLGHSVKDKQVIGDGSKPEDKPADPKP